MVYDIDLQFVKVVKESCDNKINDFLGKPEDVVYYESKLILDGLCSPRFVSYYQYFIDVIQKCDSVSDFEICDNLFLCSTPVNLENTTSNITCARNDEMFKYIISGYNSDLYDQYNLRVVATYSMPVVLIIFFVGLVFYFIYRIACTKKESARKLDATYSSASEDYGSSVTDGLTSRRVEPYTDIELNEHK